MGPTRRKPTGVERTALWKPVVRQDSHEKEECTPFHSEERVPMEHKDSETGLQKTPKSELMGGRRHKKNGKKWTASSLKASKEQSYRLQQIEAEQDKSSSSTVAKSSRHFREKLSQSSSNSNELGNYSLQRENLRDYLQEALSKEEYECMVCFEYIKRSKAVWSCDNCFAVFHLFCVRKWSKSRQGLENDQSGASEEFSQWQCPGCRKSFAKAQLGYYCFCGKVKEPTLQPGFTPHSCGEVCGKSRAVKGSDCPHKCPELCHPGPCPPCSSVREPQTCRCGKKSFVVRCSEPIPDEGYSCDLVCSKKLPCGHICERICHEAGCGPCQVPVNIHCFCGSSSFQLPCHMVSFDHVSQGGFSCGGVCSRQLACGNHHCCDICHPGICGSCPYLPELWRTCACGKVNLWPDVYDIIELCSWTHLSKTMWHEVACGLVKRSETIEVACSLCSEEMREKLVCNRSCGSKLECKRHKCDMVCCPFSKKNKKKQAKGSFQSNEDFAVIISYLGADIWNEYDHSCKMSCDKLLNCGEHLCDLPCGHHGNCYPCGILKWDALSCAVCHRPCQKQRACGHVCPDLCHYGDCPRCVVLVKKECVGGHGVSRTVPCFVEEVLCGRICGKVLHCGIHVCKRNCHSGRCEDANLGHHISCGNICRLPRRGCGHPCRYPCHPTERCPTTPCEHKVTVTCNCGMRKEEDRCQATEGQTDFIRLECDDNCSRLHRAKAFADAVGLNECAEESETKYSDFLIEFCEDNMEFVCSVEQSLNEMLKGGFGRRIKTQQLPRLYRAFIYEISAVYGLETTSIDNYPEKEMCITFPKDLQSVCIPKQLLTDYVQKLVDQRKQERQDRRRRKLRIQLIGENDFEVAKKKLQRILLPHEGTYKILDHRIVERAVEMDVEFSSIPRTTSVLNSLQSKTPTIVIYPFTNIESGDTNEWNVKQDWKDSKHDTDEVCFDRDSIIEQKTEHDASSAPQDSSFNISEHKLLICTEYH
eukprot:jgi/Galph1/2669/GphlegSOOS_G1369.1